MPRARTVLLLVAAAGAAAACATNGTGSPASSLPGCYFFVDEAGRAVGGNLPWGVELLDAPLEGWPGLADRGARRAVTLTPAGTEDHPFGYWLPSTAGDTLTLGYPGMGRYHVELTVSTDGRILTGTATPVGDARPMGGRDVRMEGRPVRLTQARCPADAGAP